MLKYYTARTPGQFYLILHRNGKPQLKPLRYLFYWINYITIVYRCIP